MLCLCLCCTAVAAHHVVAAGSTCAAAHSHSTGAVDTLGELDQPGAAPKILIPGLGNGMQQQPPHHHHLYGSPSTSSRALVVRQSGLTLPGAAMMFPAGSPAAAFIAMLLRPGVPLIEQQGGGHAALPLQLQVMVASAGRLCVPLAVAIPAQH